MKIPRNIHRSDLVRALRVLGYEKVRREIESHPRESSSDGKALMRVIEDGFHLVLCHAGKPFDKIIDAGAVFQVLE